MSEKRSPNRTSKSIKSSAKRKNYSTRDSHVVTHHSINLAIHCLTTLGLSGREAVLSVFYDRSCPNTKPAHCERFWVLRLSFKISLPKL
jgi:hypothetical protein